MRGSGWAAVWKNLLVFHEVAVMYVLCTKVAVVFESADGDLEETVSPGDGRVANSSKLRGYGRRWSWFSFQIKGIN